MNEENGIETENQKPQVFFKNITFNDDTSIALNHNSIIVFTGANNSGKSQILKDAENNLCRTNSLPPIVLKTAEYEFFGIIDDSAFIEERFFINNHGNYQPFETSFAYDISTLKRYWDNHTFYNDLHKLFVKRLCTEMRLTVSNALQRNDNPQRHPIYKLSQSETLAHNISDYFRQAFGVDLVVNRNEMRSIPLHVGQAPDSKNYTMAQQDDYYNQVKKLPKLQEQGDGMRSFASILLDTFTSDYTITLIDEPEAFLHPPQARILGKMLAKNNPINRQLIISTHSEDFLQGLLDADNENVTVIRINRMDNINRMNILKNEEIKTLWSNPILRYSNILSGLFHEKVVICESDYDCLFYQAVMNAMSENKNEIAPDILFTHCGGKCRVKDVVAALKAVNVPVVAVCDFDLINQSNNLKSLIKSFGADWETMFSDNMKVIYDSMNAKNSKEYNAWEQIKKIGKAGFTGEEFIAYEYVESTCKSIGLFVVPVGEMECFVKSVNKEKKEWVYDILENYNLSTDPKLEEARKFVQEIVDYKIACS